MGSGHDVRIDAVGCLPGRPATTFSWEQSPCSVLDSCCRAIAAASGAGSAAGGAPNSLRQALQASTLPDMGLPGGDDLLGGSTTAFHNVHVLVMPYMLHRT